MGKESNKANERRKDEGGKQGVRLFLFILQPSSFILPKLHLRVKGREAMRKRMILPPAGRVVRLTRSLAMAAVSCFALVLAAAAGDQEQPSSGQSEAQQVDFGMVMKAEGGGFRNVVGTVTVPGDWPGQQRVRIIKENLPSGAAVAYKTIADVGRQMTVKVASAPVGREIRGRGHVRGRATDAAAVAGGHEPLPCARCEDDRPQVGDPPPAEPENRKRQRQGSQGGGRGGLRSQGGVGKGAGGARIGSAST